MEINYNLITLFGQIALLLFVASVFGQIFRRIGQPSVIGEIIGGIILGPTIVGNIFPNLQIGIFDFVNNLPILNNLIQLGMLFFMFVTGLEINLHQVKNKGKLVMMTTAFSILIPFSLGVALVYLLPLTSLKFGYQPLTAVFLGIALSISALPVILRILIDLNLIKTDVGMVAMVSAALNDLLGWTVFACLINISQEGLSIPIILLAILKISLFTLGILFIGRRFGKRTLKLIKKWFPNTSGVLTFTYIMIFLVATIAELIGIHAFFAAFLAGVASRRLYKGQGAAIRKQIYNFAISFFVPLYFVSIGLKINFIANFDFYLVVFILVTACLGKFIGATFGAFWGGFNFSKALSIGVILNARGAMEIILASMALEHGIINEPIFVALIIMAIFTTIISGPYLKELKDNYDLTR